MLKSIQAFQTSDNVVHESLDAARSHEMRKFLESDNFPSTVKEDSQLLTNRIIQLKDEFLDILTMTVDGRTRARRKRSAKTVAESANGPSSLSR